MNALQSSPARGLSAQNLPDSPHEPKPGDEQQLLTPQHSLPKAYLKFPEQAPYCSKRFGIPYLETLRDSATDYCTPESSSKSSSDLTCFHSQTAGERVDSMCIGRNARFDGRFQEFRVGCELVNSETPSKTKTGVRVPEWGFFETYMYQTGPGYILNQWLNAGERKRKGNKDEDGQKKKEGEEEITVPKSTSNYTLLVKREGEGNLWHCLVELFSMFLSMDVLQMSPRPGDGKPFFTEADMANTQVVFLDNRVDGPYIDLWSVFAKKPIRRFKELRPEETTFENVIVPLAGGGNPLWEHSWGIHPCDDSPLIRTFARRVLDHYGIEDHQPRRESPQIVLTYIDRSKTRVLLNHTEFFDAVQAKYPHVTVQSIDFANISFAEQLETVQHTDILVGVHGAGMAHEMFLTPGSALVEILPPGVNFKGYRNIADLVGLSYYSAHADTLGHSGEEDWHGEDVVVAHDHFMEIMEVAIKSMYNKGNRDYDVA